MLRPLQIVAAIACFCINVFGQAAVPTAPGYGLKLPAVQATEQMQHPAPAVTPRSGFLKQLTIESFGYGLSPVPEGFESPLTFTNSTLLSSGLECPRCIPRPAMERTRFTLPPFGAETTLPVANGRTELLAGLGGVNAWKPDNTGIEPNRRDSSFNDAWLFQGNIGSAFALDANKHIWIGPVARYVKNFGRGKQHWNSLTGFASFRFGH